jgi:hypothetical protein
MGKALSGGPLNWIELSSPVLNVALYAAHLRYGYARI